MKVQELIIDGFKSYAARTVISGWDSSFNCITGLNGSGKSNILDAICFVLGITTMSTVRAQNMQDLIYKRGQAGVTKASVTIVFDNADKDKSPLGLEDCPQISVTRQIAVGGTSKFLINGHRAQQQTVQQLFQSVQLNINNPNFLIMQGQITKVLNMRPAEFLGLIEEAAGTRMFEDRKDKAVKTMDKKDKKIQEIMDLLAEEVEPKLEILRLEKRKLLEYQQVHKEFERQEKILVAYDYTCATRKLHQLTTGLQEEQRQAELLELQIVHAESHVQALKQQAQQIEQEQTLNKNKSDINDKVNELEQAVARITTSLQLQHDAVADETRALNNLQATELSGLQGELAVASKALKEIESEYYKCKQDSERSSRELERQDELLTSLQTGIASKRGNESGFEQQLAEEHAKMNQAQTEAAQLNLKLTHLQQAIQSRGSRVEKAIKAVEMFKQEHHVLSQEHSRVAEALKSAGFDPEALGVLTKRERELQHQVRAQAAQVDALQRRLGQLEVSYATNNVSFKPASVKGLVARLFTMEPKNHHWAQALEVTAGGRLYHIVVDTDATAGELLQRGQMRRRVTVIPLNRISAFCVPPAQLHAARTAAPGKLELALDVIGFEPEVSRAMQHVFGSTVLALDAETAKRVTFDPSIRVKSVTRDGDVYDPQGTLFGGSQGNGNNNNHKDESLLLAIQRYNGLATDLAKTRTELGQVRQQIESQTQLLARVGGLKTELDTKEHKLKLLKEELESGTAAQLLANHAADQSQLTTLSSRIKDCNDKAQCAQAAAAEIEAKRDEFNNNRPDNLHKLEKEVEALHREAAEHSAKLKRTHAIFEPAQIRADQLASDVAACQQLIDEKSRSLQLLQSQLVSMKQDQDRLSQEQKQAVVERDRVRAETAKVNTQLQSVLTEISSKSKFVTESKLKIQEQRHALENANQEVARSTQFLQQLLQKHDWVEDQKRYYDQPGSPYNSDGVDINQLRVSARRLRERLDSMKKHVNTQVLNMIENVEKKEQLLKGNIQKINKDRKMIQDTITSLDEYKRDALLSTWQRVTEDFGKIFGDLLPGNTSKLVLSNNNDIMAGLEVQVCIGGVWKEGLSELSGGQRSLIALSLILALLQFKPAPMYILDEVDAALDLHHTQNIGQIIKTRFKGSQFIVVSLKEGMFTNASRVFRTRFQDGTSIVSVM